MEINPKGFISIFISGTEQRLQIKPLSPKLKRRSKKFFRRFRKIERRLDFNERAFCLVPQVSDFFNLSTMNEKTEQ